MHGAQTDLKSVANVMSVAGSIPVPSAIFWRGRIMVLQRLAKSPTRNGCQGSNPCLSATSNSVFDLSKVGNFVIRDVAKWSGNGPQNRIHQFDSDHRVH